MSVSVDYSEAYSAKYKKPIYVITYKDEFGVSFEYRSDNNVNGRFSEYRALSRRGSAYHAVHLYGMKGYDLQTLVGKKNYRLAISCFDIIRVDVDINDFV